MKFKALIDMIIFGEAYGGNKARELAIKKGDIIEINEIAVFGGTNTLTGGIISAIVNEVFVINVTPSLFITFFEKIEKPVCYQYQTITGNDILVNSEIPRWVNEGWEICSQACSVNREISILLRKKIN
jgi:hypothetical protein